MSDPIRWFGASGQVFIGSWFPLLRGSLEDPTRTLKAQALELPAGLTPTP